jgi:hypothetical protein
MDSAAKAINRKIQAIVGVVVFLIAFITYTRTVAPTTSFWDCGEFIACSYILGVMHPPGAPLYLLIGRILTMFPFIKDIGLRVNMFSVFVSATTVFFAYLIIIQLIRRWRGEAKNLEDRFIMYFSSAFGALAFAFTDSFWFNAVEAEVYAFSMFFTAIVVWLALYWGEHSEKAGSMTLIFLIFYLFGLATGVHLLNILAYPFVLLVAFFHENKTVRNLLMLIFVQAIVPFTLYVIFFQFDPANMSYTAINAHQAKAWNFLKYFGTIWIIVSLIYMYRKDRGAFRAWWVIPVLVLIGYSTYILIYLRAGLDPPINENAPSTLQGMADYLGRKQYGNESLFLTFMHRQAEFWRYQVHFMYTRYFGWQFIGKGIQFDANNRVIEILSLRGLYGLPFLVGLWGAVHHFFRDKKRALSILMLFFLTGYAIIVYLDQKNPEPRERDYSYVGSFFAFALWIGIGVAGIFEWISDLMKHRLALKKMVFALATIVLLVAVPINLFAFNFESHDRSGNYIAYDYSYNILESCAKDGIIFTNGDNDTFPLWFLQEVYGIRKDVRVVNLSLLNTHWYIKQLRDNEPKVQMGLSDHVISRLYPMAWKTQQFQISIPEDVRGVLKKELDPDDLAGLSESLTFKLEPTFQVAEGGGLRVQDLMILRILEAAKWKKPVYFAVTVSRDNMIGLDEYLRMDGLAFRVLPYKVKHIDSEILKKNLLEKYQYRGLNDPSVHFNRSTIALLQNYRSAYRELARHYLMEGKKEETSFVLDEMARLIPPTHIPYSSEQLALIVADLYRRIGRDEEVEKQFNYVLKGGQVDRQERIWLAGYYGQFLNKWDRAEEILLELINENRDDVQAYSELFQVYRMSEQYEKGARLLENWLLRHPEDTNAQRQLEQLRQLAERDSSFTGEN